MAQKKISRRKEVSSLWKNVQEIDLRPVRKEAEYPIQFALIGSNWQHIDTFAELLRTDIYNADRTVETPVMQFLWDDVPMDLSVDTVILLVTDRLKDRGGLRRKLANWLAQGQLVLVLSDAIDGKPIPLPAAWNDLGLVNRIQGDIFSDEFMQKSFIPLVLNRLPEQHIPIARNFPLFRDQVAQKLISDTAFSNAVYSFTTGLAEIVPVLDIPLNVADIVVLTKAQAFLVYKLGLSLGHSTEWRDYVAEFGSVLGSGFLWRQVARSLVGLIPVWGIVPKVGVAYGGTYAVGQVIVQWHKTGRHVTKAQIKQFYRDAFERGKEIARSMLEKRRSVRLRKGERKALLGPRRLTCPVCGEKNNRHAQYCQYCGAQITGD